MQNPYDMIYDVMIEMIDLLSHLKPGIYTTSDYVEGRTLSEIPAVHLGRCMKTLQNKVSYKSSNGDHIEASVAHPPDSGQQPPQFRDCPQQRF